MLITPTLICLLIFVVVFFFFFFFCFSNVKLYMYMVYIEQNISVEMGGSFIMGDFIILKE